MQLSDIRRDLDERRRKLTGDPISFNVRDEEGQF